MHSALLVAMFSICVNHYFLSLCSLTMLDAIMLRQSSIQQFCLGDTLNTVSSAAFSHYS